MKQATIALGLASACLIAMLASPRIPHHAHEYVRVLRQGGALVIVRVDGERARDAYRICEKHPSGSGAPAVLPG